MPSFSLGFFYAQLFGLFGINDYLCSRNINIQWEGSEYVFISNKICQMYVIIGV